VPNAPGPRLGHQLRSHSVSTPGQDVHAA
jgi:hypothetical protein